MAAGNGESLPTTELFVNGITASRLLSVARVLPTLLKIRPHLIDRHPGIAKEQIAHVGIFLRKHEVWLPDYHPDVDFMIPAKKESTLYLPESGGIAVCTLVEGESPEEVIFDEELLEYYDTRPQDPDGLPVYTTQTIGGAITRLACRNGLLNDLRQFAAPDMRPLA